MYILTPKGGVDQVVAGGTVFPLRVVIFYRMAIFPRGSYPPVKYVG